MAMSSGTLGIMTCPGGTCSSIACVVCGNVAGPQSLCNLMIQAGLSIPNNMTNFHGFTIGDLAVCPTPITSIAIAGATCPTYVCSVCPNTTTVAAVCTWLHAASPVTPNPTSPGTSLNVCIDANVGAARCGTVTYTPAHCGSVQTITFCQLGITWKCVDFSKNTSSCGSAGACALNTLIYSSARVANECFSACISSALSATGQAAGSWVCIDVCCNTTRIWCCCTTGSATPNCAFCVDYNDTININIYACASNTACVNGSCGHAILTSITCCAGCGYFSKGSLCTDVLACTG